MSKRTIYIILFSLFQTVTQAQQFYIRGEVRDEGGNALQNVSILQQSTGYLFYSGQSGAFGITTAHKLDSLVFTKDGFEKAKVAADPANLLKVVLKRTPVKNARGYKLASMTQDLKRELQQQWFVGDETYASIIENQFISAGSYPQTQLTLNVDRASYSNIRRFLNMNNPVPPDAVRIEEMLNYFNLDYAEPPPGKTFAIHSVLTTCPWKKESLLLFAQIHSKKIALDTLPPSHLVFLIDISGSMDMPNRLPLLKSGFRALVNNLRPVDSVSIVVYGGTVGVMLDATSGAEKEKIFKAIDDLTPGGSTPGESGVKLAYSVARNHFIKNGNNRVILATDGDFNVGLRTETELEEMIAAQRATGVYLTCLGIGMGNYKDSKIQTLAQKGNGNFAYIDSYAEAEKVLLQEFTQTLFTVADDVHLNVRFDTATIKEYRLIGFDNKVGAIKDSLSVVEGGEVGSAYSLLVAFEIVPVMQPSFQGQWLGSPVQFTLNFKRPGDSTVQELREEPLVSLTPFAGLPKSLQLAGSLIMFGSMLRNSRYMKEVSWGQVLQIAQAAADAQNNSQKELVVMIQQARGIYAKKRKKGD